MGEAALEFSKSLEELRNCSAGMNIADRIAQLSDDNDFPTEQTSSIVYQVLNNEWHYYSKSLNLSGIQFDAGDFTKSAAAVKCCDLVLVYHHPDIGAQVINPKNPEFAELIEDFRRNELVVVYAGYCGKKDADETCSQALEYVISLLKGKEFEIPETLRKGTYTYKRNAPTVQAAAAAPVSSGPKKTGKVPVSIGGTAGKTFSFSDQTRDSAPAAKASSAQKPVQTQSSRACPESPARSGSSLKKMSPMLSVQVTNELFHNGNVEAWKRIIASYEAKYPHLQIFIYYDGERITDINALFKWGKVKHGSCIQFVVVGDNLQDVAKLKRYFTQGASNMFEAFLQGAPGTILRLF